MNSKIILAVVIAAVAVIGIAAFALTSSEDDPKEDDSWKDQTYDDTEGDLKVYGNANNDLVIDENDVKYIQDVISKKVSETPFSDANHDGTVDDADVEQVRKMIERADGTKVNFIDGNGIVNTVEWPVNKVVIVEHPSSMHSVHAQTIALGLDPAKVLAYNKDDALLYAPYKDCNVLKTFTPKEVDQVTAYGVPDVVLTGLRYVEDEGIRDVYHKLGVDIIPSAGVNGNDAPISALTLGYVLDCVEKSHKVYQFYKDLEADLTSKVAKIPADQKKDGMLWFGSYAVCGQGHTQALPMTNAGIENAADFNEWKKLDAGENTWILKYKPDFIFRITPVGYDADADKGINIYKANAELINVMDVYKDGHFYVMDSSITPLVKSAYFGEIAYPEIFGEGYGDKWHQKLVDLYGMDYTCSGQGIITFEEATA